MGLHNPNHPFSYPINPLRDTVAFTAYEGSLTFAITDGLMIAAQSLAAKETLGMLRSVALHYYYLDTLAQQNSYLFKFPNLELLTVILHDSECGNNDEGVDEDGVGPPELGFEDVGERDSLFDLRLEVLRKWKTVVIPCIKLVRPAWDPPEFYVKALTRDGVRCCE